MGTSEYEPAMFTPLITQERSFHIPNLTIADTTDWSTPLEHEAGEEKGLYISYAD